MKYKCFRKFGAETTGHGDYWRGAAFHEHLALTPYQTTYRYLLKHYPSPRRILEAGCGIGRWAIPLAMENYEVTGVDVEAEALDTIRQNYHGPNLNLVRGNVSDMRFDSGLFDVVLSLGVLEHFEESAAQERAIREHARVMKDDGILLVTVPFVSAVRLMFHMPYLKLLSVARFLEGKKEGFTEYRYSAGTFKKVLERCNLSVVHVLYDELLQPYNFGLTVDYPINRFFRSRGQAYTTNDLGKTVFNGLWNIWPGFISGGIGFVCKKKQKSSQTKRVTTKTVRRTG